MKKPDKQEQQAKRIMAAITSVLTVIAFAISFVLLYIDDQPFIVYCCCFAPLVISAFTCMTLWQLAKKEQDDEKDE